MNRVLLALLLLSVSLPALSVNRADSTYRRVPCTITAAGGSLLLNAVITEGLKHSVKELRPDRSANNSFPSRHTSWAFAASTVLSNELYRYSPWWSVGSQALASAVGFQRISARRHWGSDVCAGATIGVLSTELSYFISRKIFGMPSPWSMSPASVFRPTLALSSDAVYWLSSKGNRELCTGFGASLRFRQPLCARWGLAATVRGASMPVKLDGMYSAPLSAVSAMAGGAGHLQLHDERLAIVCNAEIGAIGWLGKDEIRPARCGFIAELGCGLEWHLTHSFGFRGQAAYNLAASSAIYHAITLSLSSVVIF